MLEVVDEWLVDIVGEDLDALMCQVHLERRPTGERRRKCSCAVRYIAFKKFDGALLTACVSQHYIQVRLVFRERSGICFLRTNLDSMGRQVGRKQLFSAYLPTHGIQIRS